MFRQLLETLFVFVVLALPLATIIGMIVALVGRARGSDDALPRKASAPDARTAPQDAAPATG